MLTAQYRGVILNKNILLNVFLNNNSLNLLCEALGAEIGCPIIVTDNAFHIVSSYAPEGFGSAEYRKTVSHSELSFETAERIEKAFENSGDGFVCLQGEENVFCCSALSCGGAQLGFLIYIESEEKLPSFSDRSFFETLLSKQFFFEKHCAGKEIDTAEEILTALLNGSFKERALFEREAAGTFLAHFSPLCFAVLDISGLEEKADKSFGIKNALSVGFHASHPFVYKGKVIMFLHEDHDAGLLKKLSKEYNFSGIISEKLSDLYSLKEAYLSVSSALEYHLKKEQEPFVIKYSDCKLLMAIKTAEEVCGICDGSVEKIFNYDKENSTELCLTFYTYLVCRHSLKETAERLFTHRNTVQYRIKKLKDEFLIDPDDSDKMLSYILSLSCTLFKLGYNDIFK